MRTTVQPAYEEWSTILCENIAGSPMLRSILGADVVAEVRQAVVQEAVRYTDKLLLRAKDLGIQIAGYSLPQYDPDIPIVTAGHQPLIYHWGLYFKNLKLSQLANDTGSFGLNTIIDTDVGDAGRIMWPLVRGESISIKFGSVAVGPELYRAQTIAPIEHLDALFAEIVADLERSGCTQAAASTARVAELYKKLSGESVVIANSLVRWAFEPRSYCEVPLSHILRISKVARLLTDFAKEYERVVPVYNQTLDNYRREHKIKNAANPFPNMRIEDGEYELPLWEVSDDSRKPVVASKSGVIAPTGSFLAPRGSISTLLLRGYCSDVAVHGLGGAKYDPFVDEFACALYGVRMPKFVVASCTKYLFPDVVERYENARQIKTQYKEMVSHTEKFFGATLFSAEDEAVLRPLVSKRGALLEALRAATDPESRSKAAHQLNALNKEIKESIDKSAVAPILADAAIDDAALARWSCREFPFFMIDTLR